MLIVSYSTTRSISLIGTNQWHDLEVAKATKYFIIIGAQSFCRFGPNVRCTGLN